MPIHNRSESSGSMDCVVSLAHKLFMREVATIRLSDHPGKEQPKIISTRVEPPVEFGEIPMQMFLADKDSQVDGEHIVATATRMGRKPLSDGHRRDKPFRIRMTDEERQQVNSAAESAGDNSSSRWGRRVLLEAAVQELARKRQRKA